MQPRPGVPPNGMPPVIYPQPGIPPQPMMYPNFQTMPMQRVPMMPPMPNMAPLQMPHQIQMMPPGVPTMPAVPTVPGQPPMPLPNQFLTRPATHAAPINNTLLLQQAQLLQNVQQATLLRAIAARNAAHATESALKNLEKVNEAISTPVTNLVLGGPTGAVNTSRSNSEGVLLFVGKLCSRVTDKFLTNLLNACGKVLKWNRMKDTFGFVKFETAEGALRCLTLIRGLDLYGNELVVNAPDKAKKMIEAYKQQHELIESAAKKEAEPEVKDENATNTPTRTPKVETTQDKVNIDNCKHTSCDSNIHKHTNTAADRKEKDNGDQHSQPRSNSGSRGTGNPKKEDRERKRARRHRDRDRDDKKRRRDRQRRDQNRNRQHHYRSRSRSHERRLRRTAPRDEVTRQRSYQQRLQKLEAAEPGKRDEATKQFLQEMIGEQYELHRYDPTKPTSSEKQNQKKKLTKQSSGPKRRERQRGRVTGGETRTKAEEHMARERARHRTSEARAKLSANEQLSFGFKRSSGEQVASSNSKLELDGVFVPIDQPTSVNSNINADDLVDSMEIVEQREEERNTTSNISNSKGKTVLIRSTHDVIALIPKAQTELLEFSLDWAVVDEAGIIEKVMRKWLNDRFCEYLGQEEQDLVSFVVQLLNKHHSGRQVIAQLRMVLDKDTEQFVLKMWRRLVFETLKAIYKV